MRPGPVLGVTLRLLPLWLAWLLVVVLGRLVCRLAQRIPPIVRLVRRLRAGDGRCSVTIAAVLGGGASAHGAPVRRRQAELRRQRTSSSSSGW